MNQPVERPGSAREAYQVLARAQKSGAGVPWYMRVVNRRLGRLIAAVASQTSATPNVMTAVSFASFVLGAGMLVALKPGVAMAIGATVALQAGFAFDSADGQLARLTGSGSAAGEWLDHVVDSARHLMFHLAIAVGLHRFTDVGDWVVVVAMVFAVVSSVRFFAQILAEQLAGRDAVAGPESVPKFGVWIQAPADTGVLNMTVLLWAFTPAFVVAYTVLAAANSVLLAATLMRRYRELTAVT